MRTTGFRDNIHQLCSLSKDCIAKWFEVFGNKKKIEPKPLVRSVKTHNGGIFIWKHTDILECYCLLLRELFSYSVVWSGIVPEPIVWKLNLTSHLILEVNLSSFILSNLVILTTNDKQTTTPSIRFFLFLYCLILPVNIYHLGSCFQVIEFQYWSDIKI
jgi:hypothetical protein